MTEATIASLLRIGNDFLFQSEEFLKQHELTTVQYQVIQALWESGDGSLTCQEITDALTARAPDVTRLTDRLEKRGLVEKTREEQDRRVVRVKLLPAGEKLVLALNGPVIEQNRRFLALLTTDEKRQLLLLLDKVLRSRNARNTIETPHQF